MRRFDNYDFTGFNNLWGHTDILDTDLEKIEFDKNFHSSDETYGSILDQEPIYHSLMNFHEEEQDALYACEEESEDDQDVVSSDDDTFDNRNSYRNADRDDAYYLI